MKKHSRDSAFKFTSKHFFRLLIFSLVIFFSIVYLSSRQFSNSFSSYGSVLGDDSSSNPNIVQPLTDFVWTHLPENSRQSLQNLSDNPLVKDSQTTVSNLQSDIPNFVQSKIKELKKAIVKNIADDIIKSIDNQ